MILGVLTLLTSYLVILPITNGISNLFGRLVGTYQTALVIGGAYVTYKTFFEKKDENNYPQLTQEEPSGQTRHTSTEQGGIPQSRREHHNNFKETEC